MDPDANLQEQLEIARSVVRNIEQREGNAMPDLSEAEIADAADRLAELILALDEWLRHGGFLPHPWSIR